MGFTSRRVAEVIGIDVSGLLRIENGENMPSRTTARRIHRFYKGAIPLGVIYDPAHKESHEWFKRTGRETLATIANELEERHPKLAVRVLERRAAR